MKSSLNKGFFQQWVLLSFGFLRKLRKTNGVFKYKELIFQRWIRIVVLIFGSLLFVYIVPLVGEGPIWHKAQDIGVNPCEDSTELLKILFLVQNYFGLIDERVSFFCNELY